MSRIGRPNLLDRFVRAVRGWIHPKSSRAPAPGPTRAIGHRGAAREAPENTLASFRKALAQGAAGIETDVCATRDGHFVLFHDANPNEKVALIRETVGEQAGYLYSPDVANLGSEWRRPIRELTLAEVDRHCGYRRDHGLWSLVRGASRPSVRVARMKDLTRWASRNPALETVLLDLKLAPEETDAAARLYRELADLPRRKNVLRSLRFQFLTVHEEIFEALARESRNDPVPTLIVTPDFEYPGVLDFVRRTGARDVSLGCGQRAWADFRDEVVEVLELRKSGGLDSVLVWTISGRPELEEMVRLGVDAIVTDDVRGLRSVLTSFSANS